MNQSAEVPRQRLSFSDSVALLVEELTAKLQAGEAIDVDAVLAAHPEDAEQLRRLLPALMLLAEVSQSADGPAPGAARGVELGELGDFRLIREVGRGGMGVVYEAEQLSLGRRVALKVLPFAATMDPRHLQRFQNEARAAASLDHPHIVHVHAVGCERAVHFYAMQFIDGQTLAAIIADLRSAGGRSVTTEEKPTAPHVAGQPAQAAETSPRAAASTARAPRDRAYFRRVAEWGIQAAEALEHAHSLGIIHRDVKPANLIVDGAGNLWVTDFGLARTASDAGLTMTGDLLGTLRYMSPEQALARHGLVDHRTDVYSLGATLYELLTGRPAVAGEDRQEILRRIGEEEPRPPRALDATVSADLETIVLKALAHEPGDRYSTAEEFADDLRHFLNDRPIQAKRPTWSQRLRKWGLRHRHWVGASALCGVMMTVALAVSTFLLWREKERTEKALAEARTNHAQAEAQRQRAENNFQEAFWAIEHILAAFDPDRSFGPVTVAELKQYQTGEALRFLSAFCEQPSDDPAVRLQQGAAYVHTGEVYQVLSERDKAQRAFRQAVAVFSRLVEEFPDEAKYRRELGWALWILAADLHAGGRLQEANACYAQSVGVWREAIRTDPDDADSLSQLAEELCQWFDPSLRDPRGAVGLASRAVALAPHLPKTWLALGIASYRSGEWNGAVTALQQALRVLREGDWTRAHIGCYLAMAQWRCGKPVEARDSYRDAVRLMEENFDARDLALRAEAAALLGVEETAPPMAKEESPRKE